MLNLTSGVPARSTTEFLAIPVCQDFDLHKNETLQALCASAKAYQEFKGEKGQQILLYDPPDKKIQRAVFFGLGKQQELEIETLRIFGGKAVTAAQAAKCSRILLAVPDAANLNLKPADMVRAVGEGAYLANHAFEKYKSDSKYKALEKISLLVPSREVKGLTGMIGEVEVVCTSTLQAREWVSTPSNDKPPMAFARTVAAEARKAGLKAQIHDRARLQRDKFGALLAVAAGSSNPPCLVELVHAPKGAKKTIVLVGKGVTFDTGGISLKPSSNMDLMKSDMAGAAAVAATLLAAARLKPQIKIIGVLPLVENMPSGTATRPGDVITSYSGKTVEIGNTDAEGRLILIDAMAYAVKKHKPDVMVDLATLTGACIIALGDKIAGIFSPDDALAQAIVDAGQATYERCWRLPLPPDYSELMKSKIADISNMSSTRSGGSITAALFMKEFVGEARWAHIDIAGPSFDKKGGDYCGPGGTGFGVRLLWNLLERL